MKKIQIFTILLGALLIAGCHRKHDGNANPYADSANINLEGVARLPLEGFELIVVQDHEQSMPADLFKGTDDELLARVLANGKANASINAVLLVNEEHCYLFDSGLGAANGGLLLQKLAALNIKPENVDAVCLTHLHPDHIGGMIYNESATFPNAQILLSVQEFEAWTNGTMNENESQAAMISHYADRIAPFCDGDTLQNLLELALSSYEKPIVAHLAPGHTPGHTLFQAGEVLICGDLLHAMALQVDHPEFCATFDHDKAQAVESRKQYLQYAQDNHLILVGMHFPLPGYIDYRPE